VFCVLLDGYVDVIFAPLLRRHANEGNVLLTVIGHVAVGDATRRSWRSSAGPARSSRACSGRLGHSRSGRLDLQSDHGHCRHTASAVYHRYVISLRHIINYFS